MPVAVHRWGYLLIGGVLMPAYAGLAGLVIGWVGRLPVPAAGSLGWLAGVLLAAVLILLTGLVPAVATAEVAAATALLATTGSELLPSAGRGRAARWRAAGWYALHLVAGAGCCGLLVGAPLGAVAVVPSPWGWPVAAGAVVAAAGLGVLVGRGLAAAAPRLLGPGPAERLALLAERMRRLTARQALAREVHDSVGHALTVMTLQATAARTRLDDPAFVTRALAAISDTGRASLAELDHVLAALRDDTDPQPSAPGREAEPLPGLDRIEELLAAVRETGTGVEVRLDAVTARLPPAVSQVAYRIAQEALTNALRHAPGAPVTVDLRLLDGGLRLLVTNHAERAAAGTGAGGGLAGMRERAESVGGLVRAGAVGERWEVQAWLPVG